MNVRVSAMSRFKQYKATDKISVDNFNEFLTFVEALANMKVAGGSFVINKSGAALDVSAPEGSTVYLVHLQEPITEGSITSPTTSTASPFFVHDVDTESVPNVTNSATTELTVVNRTSYTADSGDIILIVRVDLGNRWEWQPLLSSTSTTVPAETGSGDCSCGNCVGGLTIPHATECCTSFLGWTITNPWLECAKTTLTLTYVPNNKWITESFEGPHSSAGVFNEYRYLMEIDVQGKSYLRLVLVTDNGAGPVCLQYGKNGFDCQCDNVLSIKKPWGKIRGINREKVTCNVCINLVPPTILPLTSFLCGGMCDIPTEYLPVAWTYTAQGEFAGGMCNTGAWGGAFKYTGDFCCGGASSLDVQHIDVDVNQLEGQLMTQVGRIGGFGSTEFRWAHGYGISPSVNDSNACVQNNSVLAPAPSSAAGPAGGYYVGTSNIRCQNNAGQLSNLSCNLYHAGLVQLICMGTSGQTCNVQLRFVMFEAPIDRNTCSDHSATSAGTYYKNFTGISPSELPCIIAQQHTLQNMFPDYVLDSYNALCGGQLSPVFDTPSLPDSITITPLGGGTPDCPVSGLGVLPVTSTGACGSNCVSPASPANTNGYCCYGGLCLNYVPESFCDLINGDWTASGDCSNSDCYNAQFL